MSADRTKFVTINVSGTVQIYSTGTWKPAGQPLVEHLTHPTSVAFNADGHLLVTTSQEGAQIWDVAQRRQTRPALATGTASGFLQNAVFSPDGQLLATYRRTQLRVQVWDLATGKLYADRAEQTEGSVTGLVFAKDSSALIAAGMFGIARYDRQTLASVAIRILGTTGSVVLSPDGTRVAVVVDSGVYVLDSTTLADVHDPFFVGAGARALRFSPDGKLLAVTAADGSVTVVDMTTPSIVFNDQFDVGGALSGVDFLNSSTLVTYDQTGVAVWNLLQPASIATAMPTVKVSQGADELPDGRFVATSTSSNTVFAVGTIGSSEVAHVAETSGKRVAVSATGDVLAVVAQTNDGVEPIPQFQPSVITFFRLPGYAQVGTVQLPDTDQVRDVEFSPDGRSLAVAEGHLVHIIDVASRLIRSTVDPDGPNGNAYRPRVVHRPVGSWPPAGAMVGSAKSIRGQEP